VATKHAHSIQSNGIGGICLKKVDIKRVYHMCG